MPTTSHLQKLSAAGGQPYLSFEQVTRLKKRRREIRGQIDANPDRRLPDGTLDELRSLNEKLACEIERHVALLVRLSSRAESRHCFTLTHGQILQAQANKALKMALKTYRPRAGGRTAEQVGYVIVENARLCGLDMVGADFLLIDKRSGKFLMIDVTADDKAGLPALREAGLLHFKFFSEQLRRGLSNSEDYVKLVINRQIGRLVEAASASPLDLLSVRLPFARNEDLDRCRLADASYRREAIENLQSCRADLLLFLSDLENVAAESTPEQRKLLEEFIRHTKSHESGALRFLNQRLHWLRTYRAGSGQATTACS